MASSALLETRNTTGRHGRAYVPMLVAGAQARRGPPASEPGLMYQAFTLTPLARRPHPGCRAHCLGTTPHFEITSLRSRAENYAITFHKFSPFRKTALTASPALE